MLELILLEVPCHISIAQAKEMKQLSVDREITREKLLDILRPTKGDEVPKNEPGRRVILTEQTLKRFFPRNMTEDVIKKVIIDLLITWKTSSHFD